MLLLIINYPQVHGDNTIVLTPLCISIKFRLTLEDQFRQENLLNDVQERIDMKILKNNYSKHSNN